MELIFEATNQAIPAGAALQTLGASNCGQRLGVHWNSFLTLS
jgi:hypothetical protein